MIQRAIGERYRPIVKVKKIKKDGPRKGMPTMIEVSGELYVLAHRDQRPQKGRGKWNLEKT
ncbi:hypothetical protein [Fictibacillus gelatini]|uniref:hypothetical protein n=1 Tax=Fictibacillus gelatini TaxID=225985 RepID=UPI0003FE9654|nr:hypothetical protein [Fictibacillus gelatini]